jgi:FkbM family methyltransferase
MVLRCTSPEGLTVMKLDAASWGPPRGLDALLAFEEFGLFGATKGAILPEQLLRTHGKRIVEFYDNAPQKQGTEFRGAEVKPAQSVHELVRKGGAIIISSAYQHEIAKQLVEEMGVPSDRIFPYIGPIFAGHFGEEGVGPNLSAMERLLPRLGDQESRDYVSQLMRFRWRMEPLLQPRNPKATERYFYDGIGLGPHPGYHIVDCGAYTGDTAELFLARAKGDATVTAIEPMTRSFEGLKAWIQANNLQAKVEPVNAAAGASEGDVTLAMDFAGDDASSHVGASASGMTQSVRMRTIDGIVGQGRRVDLIKMDIEGFEIEALNGGAKVIARDRPDLALSAYHRPAHPWEIPAALDAIAPGYGIYAGHHPHALYEIEYYCVGRQ